MKKILVTGAAGYVGSSLVPKLLAEGKEVVAVDNFWFGDYLKDSPNLIKIKGDITQANPNWLDGVETILHLAGIANDPLSDLMPNLSWEISALGTRALLELSVSAGIKHFIYASSGSVYGVRPEDRVTEETELTPISLYNKVKMVTERVALSYSNDLAITIVRPATICGFSNRMRLDLAVNAITFGACKTGTINLDGGSQTRPNITLFDMCQLYLYLIQNPALTGIYNAGFENYTLNELAEKVQDLTDCKIVRNNALDPRSYRLDSSKLLATGFRPRSNVNEAIQDLISKFNLGELSDRPEWHSTSYLAQLFSK
jgi:nucleoside-diphosphate-sugar epimerase